MWCRTPEMRDISVTNSNTNFNSTCQKNLKFSFGSLSSPLVIQKKNMGEPECVLDQKTLKNRLKYLASNDAKWIREMMIKKICNPDLAFYYHLPIPIVENNKIIGYKTNPQNIEAALETLYPNDRINSVVNEEGWMWEEIKCEGLFWNDNDRRRGSHLCHEGHVCPDWSEIVNLALEWNRCHMLH